MQIDQATLTRLLRTGLRNMKGADIVRVVRRSKGLRKLINGPLAEMGNDVSLLLAMLKDYANGTYRDIPRSTALAGAFALLYVLNPFDLMPDFVPGIGYLDDMSMVALVIGSIRRDVAHYARWRRSRAAIARRLRLTFGVGRRRVFAG
ncbi:MAG: YkvA family protein [Rhodospirillaceae bacterium]